MALIKRTDISTAAGKGRGSKRVGRAGYATLIETEDYEIFTVTIYSTRAGQLYCQLSTAKIFYSVEEADVFSAHALKAFL